MRTLKFNLQFENLQMLSCRFISFNSSPVALCNQLRSFDCHCAPIRDQTQHQTSKNYNMLRLESGICFGITFRYFPGVSAETVARYKYLFSFVM